MVDKGDKWLPKCKPKTMIVAMNKNTLFRDMILDWKSDLNDVM